MNNFQLIKKLSDAATVPESTNPRIEYQQYEIECMEGTVSVLIPIRECESFEQSAEQYSNPNSHDLRVLLRKHRGIKDKV